MYAHAWLQWVQHTSTIDPRQVAVALEVAAASGSDEVIIPELTGNGSPQAVDPRKPGRFWRIFLFFLGGNLQKYGILLFLKDFLVFPHLPGEGC